MLNTVVRILSEDSGLRRVLIVRRENDTFGFEEEHWSDEPLEQCWIQRGHYSISICDSEEAAIREAHNRISWLTAQNGA